MMPLWGRDCSLLALAACLQRGMGQSADGQLQLVLCSVSGPGIILCQGFSQGSYPTVWFAISSQFPQIALGAFRAGPQQLASSSVMQDSLRSPGLQPIRLLHPWDFSRQECWSGLPFPSPGDLPNPGIEPGSPALPAGALPSEPPYSKQCSPCLPAQTLLADGGCGCLGCVSMGSYRWARNLWVLIIYLFFLPVMLPSEVPRLATNSPVRVFPGVWKPLFF